MPNALIYLRVSTQDQANQGTEPDGFSIPAQRRACVKKAEQLELARSLNLADAYLEAPLQVQRYLSQACFQRIDIDDADGRTFAGHARKRDMRLTAVQLRRTLNYQQLVYALLLLAEQPVGEHNEV